MIYIKNTTETQTIFIPRNELQKEAYITSTKTYEDGYREGLEDGKEQQKDQLLNLYVTENGQYEREDGWGVVTVDMSIPDCSGAYDEGYNQGYEDGQNSVECPEGGTCNLGEGAILLDTSMAGTYELYASDDGYDGWSKFIVNLEGGEAIKVHKASDLLDTFNNGGTIDYGTYHYVGGKITEIQEVNTQYGNATYTLDNGLLVYRGKWTNGEPFQSEDQIKVGAYIVVYGVIADYRGTLQFNAGSQVIAYKECENVSCNLEDKWVTPSMGDRDDNGYIVVDQSEGFDGLDRVVIDPTTIYNEGVSAGKAEGGDLNIGTGDIYLTANERGQRFEILPSEFEYDAFDKFIVELENFDLGGDANIYDALSVNQLLMDGHISYGNVYLFKGEITEIQRIRPEYGDARYTLDGSLNVYNGQTMGYDLQTGDNVIVYGTLSEYNGAPQLSAGSMIKVWWRSNCDDAYNNGYNDGYNEGQANCPSVQEEALLYDTIAFSYTVDGWRSHNIVRDNMTNDCDDRPLNCLLLRNRYGECTVMTKLDICSGTARLENGWNGGSIIYSLSSNTITKFSSSSINSYHLKSIDTGFAQLEENAIINCNNLTDIKVTILNNDLSYQFATNCFNGLPTEGTITIDKNAGVTLTDDEITSFFRTIVGEGWTITIE